MNLGSSPFSAFFIGGGGFTLPRAWARAFPSSNLLIAEIDPIVTEVAYQKLWLPKDSPAIEIHHRDARTLLTSLPVEQTFDVIFGDAFHDISVPAHLVTQEFHAEIAKRLRPDGFYGVNIVDNSLSPQFLAAVTNTLRKDFRFVEIWLETDDLETIRGALKQRLT